MRPGEMPFSSAATRVNGLKAEPGWRCPCVARLNGRFSKSAPPTIARTPPVLLSIATSAALGPTPPSRPAIGLLGGLLEVEVERGADLEAAAEGVAGAVAVDELVLHPGGEVGRPC